MQQVGFIPRNDGWLMQAMESEECRGNDRTQLERERSSIGTKVSRILSKIIEDFK
jgi:hypothetical protein